LSHTVAAGIKGIVLSLGLAAMVRAEGLPAQDQPPADSSATLLHLSAPAEFPAGILVSAPARGTTDRAASPVLFQPSAPIERVSSNAGELPPSVAPLPLLGAQPAQVPRRDERPPTAPSPTTTREAPRGQAAQPRPAAAGAQPQDIQFDPNGLVTHFHVNEGDLRQILELLSRRAGINILVSPRVGGTVTVNFENVTVDKVLTAVIKLANLVEKTEGSIHYIYTKGELQDEAEAVKKERILTKVYKLNYVRSDEMMSMIRPFLSTDVGKNRISTTPTYRFGISESNTFVSSGSGGGGGAGGGGGGAVGGGGVGSGAIGFQPTTGGNSSSDFDHLIIQDYESNLKIIDQIIQKVDVRPVQVLIEAVIVSVDLEHDRELGVNFAVVDNLANMLGTVGTGTALNGNVGFNPTQLLSATGQLAQSATTDAQGFTSATNGVKFGFVANNVTGFVRALETIGSTKILASPRILVLNKQRAEIQLGARLGFQTLSQNFTSTIQQVQFLNTGTLLRLRPFVSDDGMIRMEIHPERSSGSVVNNIPNQQTAELTTNVLVPDGATLVIGGLMEDEDDFQMQGLPGLSRLPVLGYLFGNRQKTEGRRELVVLLTPHIWSPDLAMAHAPAPDVARRTQGGEAARASATTSFEFPVPASATTPVAAAVSTPMPASPSASASASATISNSSTRGVDEIAPATTGTPADQDRQGSPPPKRRPWQLFSRLLPGRSPEQKPDRSTGGNGVLPNPSPNPNTASPPGATTSIRAAKSDAMVTQTSWKPDSISNPARDQRPTGLRSGGVAAGPRRHTVVGGETFATIAQLYYGSARYDQALRWANRGMIARPERLSAGDLIVIPQVDQLDASQIRPVRSIAATATVPASAPAPLPIAVATGAAGLNLPGSSAAQFEAANRTVRRDRENVGDGSPGSRPRSSSAGPSRALRPVHVVRRDETLLSIARDRLGNSHRADEIIELNQDRLPDTNQLTPGQRLLLPFDATPARRAP
jgi:general secretion pathway protein D